jgi:hypothetical protein
MFDRNGELARNSPEDLLNIGGPQKANNVEVKGAAGDSRPKTPNPWSEIKIYGEVSFTHKVIPQATAPARNVVVSGRVDHGIGRVLDRAENAAEHRKRSFYSLLLLVEAKFDGNVEHALPQLVVYLASLRQSRLQRNRKDATVYGVASDGYVFIFVKISHDGTVMRSKLFDIFAAGEMKKVLLCLRHILETTASRSPTSTPEKTAGDNSNIEREEPDPALDLNDNPFLMCPEDVEDEEADD